MAERMPSVVAKSGHCVTLQSGTIFLHTTLCSVLTASHALTAKRSRAALAFRPRPLSLSLGLFPTAAPANKRRRIAGCDSAATLFCIR